MALPQIKVNPAVQKEWGWPIAAAVFLGGLGGALFLLSNFAFLTIGMVLGIVGMCSSVGFLLVDLGKRVRFWRVFYKPRTSWLSRGAISLTGAVVFGMLYTALSCVSGLSFRSAPAVRSVIGYIADIFAFLVVLYTGFLLSASRSIPTWNTWFLPAQFVIYAFLGGIDVLIILRALGSISLDMEILAPVAILLLSAAFVLLAIYAAAMSYVRIGAKEGASLLLKGSISHLFLWGVFVVGLTIPIFIDLIVILRFPSFETVMARTLIGLGAALTLIGSFLYRYALLKTGVYNPPI